MSRSGFQNVRGTRDFYPEEHRQREWLFGHFRSVASRFAFEQVDAPMLEPAELFIRKAGEEIVDQLYHFELHDRHLALRPEFTPSLARMIQARAGSLRLPIRWFSIPQCWRYERMARGRKREHYQWNMDIWGEPGVTADAELIAACFHLFDAVGLDRRQLVMRVNSRSLVEETLLAGPLAGRPDAFAPLCVIVDKLAKIGSDAVIEQLVDPSGLVGLDRPAAQGVVDMLASENLEDAASHAPKGSQSVADLRRLFEVLDAYGVSESVRFDASTVRGLAYYTGIVFEAFDTQGKLRSICGGGRYDRLLETLGGPALPAVGFGMGDVVLTELLGDKGLLPEIPAGVDDVVFAFGDDERLAAVRVAERLRRDGRSVELILGAPRLKRVLADADKTGASRVWIIGPEEAARGVATVRDLATGEQREEDLAG
ncbi:MAG: histidine--tRNA ligase [Myxococcota bacterium]|nr:histidine--tRNA ligase [Myxococcota bacterium]